MKLPRHHARGNRRRCNFCRATSRIPNSRIHVSVRHHPVLALADYLFKYIKVYIPNNIFGLHYPQLDKIRPLNFKSNYHLGKGLSGPKVILAKKFQFSFYIKYNLIIKYTSITYIDKAHNTW